MAVSQNDHLAAGVVTNPKEVSVGPLNEHFNQFCIIKCGWQCKHRSFSLLFACNHSRPHEKRWLKTDKVSLELLLERVRVSIILVGSCVSRLGEHSVSRAVFPAVAQWLFQADSGFCTARLTPAETCRHRAGYVSSRPFSSFL